MQRTKLAVNNERRSQRQSCVLQTIKDLLSQSEGSEKAYFMKCRK